MTKEEIWRRKRIGKITSSCLHLLNSKRGKWTQTNISYLYQLQRERLLGQPKPNNPTYAMKVGIDNEKYAIEWLRHNYPNEEILHCDEDFDEKIFIETDFGLGDSPDGYMTRNDGKDVVIEIKCVVSESDLAWIFSPTVSFFKKKSEVEKQHIDQMLGHLLAHPNSDSVFLVKYDPQIDSDEYDIRSPIDKSRGLVFEFNREWYKDELDILKERIQFADSYLNSGKDIDEINKYWDEYKEEQKSND